MHHKQRKTTHKTTTTRTRRVAAKTTKESAAAVATAPAVRYSLPTAPLDQLMSVSGVRCVCISAHPDRGVLIKKMSHNRQNRIFRTYTRRPTQPPQPPQPAQSAQPPQIFSYANFGGQNIQKRQRNSSFSFRSGWHADWTTFYVHFKFLDAEECIAEKHRHRTEKHTQFLMRKRLIVKSHFTYTQNKKETQWSEN